MRPPLSGQGDPGPRRPRRRDSGALRRLRQVRRSLPGQGQAGAQRHRTAAAAALRTGSRLRLAGAVVGQRIQERDLRPVDPGAEAARFCRSQRNRARRAAGFGAGRQGTRWRRDRAAALVGLPDRSGFRAQIPAPSRRLHHAGRFAADGARPDAARPVRGRHPGGLHRPLHRQKK